MPVLIIGGGIGGLAAAVGLRRTGLQAEVYEQAAELKEVGAGISLWSNAIIALDRLGLADAVRAQAIPEIQGGIRTWDGRLLTGVSTRTLQDKYREASVALHRAELQQILMKAWTAEGSEGLQLGKHFTRFEQDEEGVTAYFSDGTQARGEALIGADGLRSVVRAQLHGPSDPVYAGYTAWRAVVPFAGDRLTPGETWGKGARFGQVPLRDGQVYWFATRNTPARNHAPAGEKAELRQIFRGWHAPIEELIENTPDDRILRNDIYDRPVLSAWGRGRVTLLGDAAHPMTPNLGQGACQALEDAVVLARWLGQPGEVGPGLRRYEQQRIPRANSLVRQSRQLGWVGQWENPAAIWLREFFLRSIAPRMQGRLMDQVMGTEI